MGSPVGKLRDRVHTGEFGGPGGEKPGAAPADATREALDFCFEDVSSLKSLGAAPLSDLISAGAPGRSAAAASSEAGGRTGQRWNLAVLALLILTLAAATAATLLGR